MLRSRSCAVALILLWMVGVCAAQEAADIIVGGQVVARVREAGPYESVEHRAAAIDETLNEILAGTDDPAALEVTLEQVDGLWSIMLDGRKVMSVYEAEAEANGTTPGVLGAMWVNNFREALPDAAPAAVQELDAPAETVVEGRQPAVSSAAMADVPTTGAVTNTGVPAVEVLEVPPAQGDPEEIVAGQGARLLILEALNEARNLPEDDYLVRREAMADELFDDIVQILTGGQLSGRISSATTAAPTPAPEPAPTVAAPTVAEPTTAAPQPITAVEEPAAGPATTPSVPATPFTMQSYRLSDEGRAKIEARIPSHGPSYANVVQKVVVKAKFRAATQAYQRMREADPAAATEALELLKAARTANNNNDFVMAEQYLDAAMRVLQVSEWERHLDAAMADFGLTG